jgi:hypothetical protein
LERRFLILSMLRHRIFGLLTYSLGAGEYKLSH